MKMNRIALGIALLTTTASALAFDGDRRTTTNGAIVWSTRNRDGNKFSLVFQFGNGGTAIDLRYQQDPNRRDVRYDRGRYGGYDQGYYPPVYDYRDYRGHEYDQRYFSCYEEWSDWKEWQKHWSKRKNWQRNSRERNRAWDAFVSERSRRLFPQRLQ